MTREEFDVALCQALIQAFGNPDAKLAEITYEVKAAVERGDIETAAEGIELMNSRMIELRLESEDRK